MGRAARTALAIALLGSAGAGAAWSVYRSLTTTTDVYTDAGSIAEPAGGTSPRGVLWESPRTELESAREPRTSPDGSVLYFVRAGPDGDADIYTTGREGDHWGEPERLTFNTRGDELSPAPAGDGSLLFVSDRAGGLGGYDIWRVRRDGESWGAPENLGAGVNTIDDEFGPAPAGDGVVYFASNRPRDDAPDGSAGVFDLFRADLRSDGARPERLASLSSDADDGPPAASPAGDFLYFASERGGGLGGSDLYRVRLLDDGFGEIEPLTGVNTEADERGPWLDTGGFRLWFGSDRGGALGAYSAMSREVYRDRSVAWGEVDWASIWRAIWPWVTGLVVALLALMVLSRLSMSTRWRRRWRTMSLMAKCVLISLLAHALLLAVLTAVHVTTTIGDLLDEPGETRVRLVTQAGAGELTAQVRGNVGEVVVEPVAAEDTPRAEPVEVEQPEVEPEASPPGEMEVAELSVAAPSAGESPDERPSEAVRADAPVLDSEVDVSSPNETSVTDAAEQVSEPSRAASRAIARRAEPPEDDGSGTPIAQAEVGALTMEDTGTSVGGEAPESSPDGSVDPAIVAAVSGEVSAEVRAPTDRASPSTAGEATPSSPGDAGVDARAAVRAEASEAGVVEVAPGRADVVEAGPVAAGVRADESSSARGEVPDIRREVEGTVSDIASATPRESGERVAGGESTGAGIEGVSAESPRADVAVHESTSALAEPAPDGLRVSEEAATVVQQSTEASAEATTSAHVDIEAEAPSSAAAAFEVDVPSESGGEGRAAGGEAAVGDLPTPTAGSSERAELTPGRGSTEAQAESLEPESLALVERGDAVGASPAESERAGGATVAPAPVTFAAPDSSEWDAAVALPSREREAAPTEQEHALAPAPSRRAGDVRAGADAEPRRESASSGRVEVEPESAQLAEASPALESEAAESRPSPTGPIAMVQPACAPGRLELATPAVGSRAPDEATPAAAPSRTAELPGPDLAAPADVPAEIAGADLEREYTEPETLDLVESAPDEAGGSREAAVELALPPPEAVLALSLPGVEARLPRDQTPPTLQLEGVVLDSLSREPLAGASVRLDADRTDSIEVVTDAQGRFRIEPRRAPTHAAVTASADEYRPSALNVSSEQFREHATVVFLLEPLDTSVVVLEDEPRVHHLGDDRFDGRINSQFQKSSEGLIYRRQFELADERLRRVSAAEVSLMVKGAQIENQIRINGRLVDRRLTGAPSDGSFGEFRARIPASWLNRGENTLEIRSVINRGTDHDDYEFVNVQVELIRPRIERNL